MEIISEQVKKFIGNKEILKGALNSGSGRPARRRARPSA